MKVTYDANKRVDTLKNRGLDFEDAPIVFDGNHITGSDDREYDEDRLITIGTLRGGIVVIVWTERDDSHRIISMRMARKDERKYYQRELDRPG